jgi:hypothetical protein
MVNPLANRQIKTRKSVTVDSSFFFMFMQRGHEQKMKVTTVRGQLFEYYVASITMLCVDSQGELILWILGVN